MAVLLFASGAIALVDQVAWQRQFALVFGSAAPATAAVLAAFLAGLGIGSLLLGRFARRWSRPLRAYAALEVLTGLGALLVGPTLSIFERIYPWLYATLADHPAGFLAVRTLLAFATLALPTCCMGGTLPVLARWLDRGPRQLGLRAGLLYAANTAGAALGALAFPLLLLPALGLSRTFLVGAIANLMIAAVAWRLDQFEPANISVPPLPQHPRAVPLRPSAGNEFPGIPAFAFLSGLVTFGLEVQWNRAFAQIHGNSIHSFAVITAVFILALAAGAQVARLGLRRGLAPRRIVAGAWYLGGLGGLAGPWLFQALTHGLAMIPAGSSWWGQAAHLAGLASAVFFVPVALLGVAVPALLEAAGQADSGPAAPLLGRLLAWNIAGCVTGALAAGFVLPHFGGLWTAQTATGGLALLAGALLGHRADSDGPPTAGRGSKAFLFRAARVMVIVIAATAAAVRLPRVRLAAGAGEKLVALSEGTYGVVAVTERPGSRRLKLNNHYSLGGTMSVGDQRLQAHLPLLLHPAPERVAILGLGTGISAGGTLFHPVRNLEIVELVPEVIAAARMHFAKASASLLADPRTRVIAGDARNHLRAGTGPWDVLLGDLVVPWREGEGALFTLEHFTAARAALAPGGLFCQWLPMFQLSQTETRILLRTFLTVFPNAWVFRGDFSADRPALALIGFREPFKLQPDAVARRLGQLRPDPLNPQLAHPVGFWLNFVGLLQPADLDPTEHRINREDRPWIELLGPLHHGGERTADLFVGRRLQTWLEQVRARSADRVSTLTAAEQNAGRMGDRLYEFSLLLQERREPEAERVRGELQARLPPPVFRAIFGTGP